MAYKTCPDCGSRIFEYGCVNCDEMEYISMQDGYVPIMPNSEPNVQASVATEADSSTGDDKTKTN